MEFEVEEVLRKGTDEEKVKLDLGGTTQVT